MRCQEFWFIRFVWDWELISEDFSTRIKDQFGHSITHIPIESSCFFVSCKVSTVQSTRNKELSPQILSSTREKKGRQARKKFHRLAWLEKRRENLLTFIDFNSWKKASTQKDFWSLCDPTHLWWLGFCLM